MEYKVQSVRGYVRQIQVKHQKCPPFPLRPIFLKFAKFENCQSETKFVKIIRIFSRRENLQNSSDPKFICPFKLNLRIKDDEVFDFRNTKIFSKESTKSNPKYTKYLHGWLIIKDHLHSNSDKSKQQMRKLNLEGRSKILIIKLSKLRNKNFLSSENFYISRCRWSWWKWCWWLYDGDSFKMAE